MPRRGISRGRAATRLLLVVGLLFGVLVASPLPSSAASPGPAAPGPASPPMAASVTWNGANISTYPSLTSALTIDFAQSANLDYAWKNAPGAGINDARLQMFYFGFAVATRDVTLSTPLTTDAGLPLNWTPLTIGYVLEGVYRLTASLIAPNGTTMWSENFYVRGNAPFGFVAVIPIVLLALAIYEVYALVRSGRYAALGRKPPSPPTKPTPAESPAAGSPSSAVSAPPSGAGTAEPPADAPTDSGGGS